ncbi:AAA domain-containing protein [Candidatus Dependentiae bacterium]|nr:AAA domain-containing protein [Candidatus Dependentiae bacterium]
MQNKSIEEISSQIKELSFKWQILKDEIKKLIVGQDHIIDRIFIGLLCNGHILLEGVPGLAKTTLIKSLSKAIGLGYNRIQFTPDLLPSDLIGTLIYNPKNQEFITKKGPIFSNLILADEINRAPAKVQSALLEAMQEYQITIGDKSYNLDKPFLVLATQNPIEQEGTYKLPEAQVDRFLFKLLVEYPNISQEKDIIKNVFYPNKINKVLETEDIKESQKLIDQIYIDEKVIDYILKIVFATRLNDGDKIEELENLIEYGASPRASLALHHASKTYAFLKKRNFVIPDDVKAVATDILRHRILLTYQAEAENITTDQIIQKILRTIPSP